MNFVQEEKGYCNNEVIDDQKEIVRETSNMLLFSSSTSSSSNIASANYKALVPQHHNFWVGTFDSQEACKSGQDTATNFDKRVELMDLSLGNSNEESSGNGGDSSSLRSIEKEHMFDKVVTPSDVGKLNRLVIPKQHAEKYFPLDSSSNEKGLLLNFEDRTGKAWRFRYSYWNSSQSYVMTKGWSRFVKEKKLDAGDIVSFQRGVGEVGKDHLYIDWRRRPDAHPDPTSLAQMQLQNQLYLQQSVRWGSRLYSLPQSVSFPRNYEHFQRMNYGNFYSHHHPHHHHHYQPQQPQDQQQILTYGNAAPPPVQYYLRPSEPQQIEALREGGNVPMVIDSVPIVHGNKTTAKRLRLFGVNMECPTQDHQSSSTIIHGATMNPVSPHSTSLNYLPPLQSREPNSASLSTSQAAEYSNKGKSPLSFDLDL